MSLTTTPNLTDHDGFYEELLAAHRDLTPDQSAALNAQLIMILANHIGDRAALSEAIALAKS
ncbi:MAG: DUF2783 domain-containing protein [Rhodobacteraceae bacterium]|jgi:hypothetical protein|nr:DUF2783 domain-containing protein [Alphaproteobacteria bacterium]MBT8475439.1 DUF2783 domain-containing protein [Alphaproteobacteria bacterium]NNF71092.1 DUF2783 domain-containing protein [Paracoccaceae bacterium]NNK66033.1 DUF2783 domain-containing protein [Paracoccaceae bacterium]